MEQSLNNISPALSVQEAQSMVRAILANAGDADAEWDARDLVAAALGAARKGLIVNRNQPIGKSAAIEVQAMLARRLRNEPMAYIVGHTDFYGRQFLVEPGVLIPRVDSEILVEVGLRALESCTSPHILELGVGSGCVLLSLMSELKAQGKRVSAIGSDLSPIALQVCSKNADALGVAGELSLFAGSWFDALPETLQHSFDLVVSNPPYIPPAEEPSLQRDVAGYEPSMALFAPKYGTEHHETILQQAPAWLKSGGNVAMECAIHQAAQIAEFARNCGYAHVEIVRDTAGIERVVRAVWQQHSNA